MLPSIYSLCSYLHKCLPFQNEKLAEKIASLWRASLRGKRVGHWELR
jgi:hypothetical protein